MAVIQRTGGDPEGPGADVCAALARRLGPSVRWGEPMSRHTSLRVGGPAQLFFVARSQDQLIRATQEASGLGVPWRVIGGASNLLVADEGVDGLIVKAVGSSQVAPHRVGADTVIDAEAGCIVAALARQTTLAGWEGLAWAANVPGTVGGAVVNNAGAFGSCVSEHLVVARVHIEGSGICRLTPEQLGMAYRTTRLKAGELVGVVVGATFRVSEGSSENLRAQLREVQRLRRETQPAGFSIGSVFANPPDGYAGLIIERTGFKGTRVGDAEVSALHANFILNRGSARAVDVIELMCSIQQRVRDRTGILLRPEVQLMGRFSPDLIGRLMARPAP